MGGGGRTGDPSASSGRNSQKNTIKSGQSGIDATRIIRNGNTLRIAFTPLKTGSVRFAVKPVGEQDMPEDVIRLTKITNSMNAGIHNNTVTVNTKSRKRTFLEIAIEQGEYYTGYEIVEYDTGVESK